LRLRHSPLDKDVVHAPAFAVHADHDPVPLQGAGEVIAGELAALVGIEDLRPAIARERFLERLDAKIGAERLLNLNSDISCRESLECCLRVVRTIWGNCRSSVIYRGGRVMADRQPAFPRAPRRTLSGVAECRTTHFSHWQKYGNGIAIAQANSTI
jgi:hypothetical protein